MISTRSTLSTTRCPRLPLFNTTRPSRYSTRFKRASVHAQEPNDEVTPSIDQVENVSNASKNKGDEDSELKLTGLSTEEMKELLIDGITASEWFVTGNVDKRLFSTTFSFKDPSVKTTGIDTYARAVSRLFDPATTMDIVSTEITGEREIKMVWRLEATINVPFKPKIKAYYVTTYFRMDASGLIYDQEEFFSVPEWELLVSIFFPNIGTPPAPPVQK